jgi:acetyltransferase-like isoleucine patch superfamily enzyme
MNFPSLKPTRRLYSIIDKVFLKRLIRLIYSSRYYPDLIHDSVLILTCAFFQKVMGINRPIPWPVRFTSVVTGWRNIKKGRRVTPGLGHRQYIQGINGIVFGSNVRIGPGVCIISANHDPQDYDIHIKTPPIEIGDNVWIGANSVVLPGVKIGSNVVVGAGSVITKNIPSNSFAAGNPCRVVKGKAPYAGKLYK